MVGWLGSTRIAGSILLGKDTWSLMMNCCCFVVVLVWIEFNLWILGLWTGLSESLPDGRGIAGSFPVVRQQPPVGNEAPWHQIKENQQASPIEIFQRQLLTRNRDNHHHGFIKRKRMLLKVKESRVRILESSLTLFECTCNDNCNNNNNNNLITFLIESGVSVIIPLQHNRIGREFMNAPWFRFTLSRSQTTQWILQRRCESFQRVVFDSGCCLFNSLFWFVFN